MNLVSPTQDHLSRLYYELEKIGARSVGLKKPWPYSFDGKEGLAALAADLSRFDPRLLEILVQYGITHWQDLNPLRLRNCLGKMAAPQTMGVVSSFILAARPRVEELSLFWNYVVSGLKPVEPQFYFRDLYLPGSMFAERAMKESLQEFRRWGFFGRERVVVDPATKKTVGTWDQQARLNILRRIFSRGKRVPISEYLEELRHTITRQQALLDIKKAGARSEGGGRSSFWRLS